MDCRIQFRMSPEDADRLPANYVMPRGLNAGGADFHLWDLVTLPGLPEVSLHVAARRFELSPDERLPAVLHVTLALSPPAPKGT